MDLDGATFLVQWGAGGLACLWVTTRGRLVSLGYGWLLRGVFGAMALAGALLFVAQDGGGTARVVATVGSFGVVVGAVVASWSSIVRRRAGVSGGSDVRARRRARVAAMVDRPSPSDASDNASDDATVVDVGPEFHPRLDLVAPAFGLVALLGAADLAGGPYALSAARLVVGALFLGAVSDAMLLGHWYLTQPGLPRDPIKELVVVTAVLWPLEVAVFLWPTGMVQVFTGAVDDGWDGLLGVIWIVSALSTIILVGVTWLALRERFYSAVMAATGLLYLAILTAFGTDLVARAVLAP
ncbi:MAG TPA: hypothetical protein VFZ83_00145 [Acidimicrobiia bacterium]|nr:hypothetical protein [Acidimicrobiia bacterium]